MFRYKVKEISRGRGRGRGSGEWKEEDDILLQEVNNETNSCC